MVSGTGASSVPASLTNATLRGFLSVTPIAILDGTQTTNTLTWDFNSGSVAFDFLATGETLVLTYTVSATDDNGTPLSDTETITVTITGSDDAPVITGGPGTSSLTESNSGLTDSGTLTVSDLDLTDTVTAAVDAVVVSGTGASSVPASLTNATLRGFLTVTPTAILDGTQTTNALTWNFNSGSEAFDFLAAGETLVLTYTVSVTDDNGTPLSDTETITVTITGTGDAPVITGGPDTSSLTESNSGLTDSGALTVTDLDLTDTVTAAVDAVVVSGTGASSVPASLTNATLRGFLSVTPTAILDSTQTTNTLTWNFNSGSEAFDFLADGETLVLTYTVSATDDNGTPLSDTETITVTITGTGDAPVITGGPDTSSLTESDTGLTDSGTLTVTDLDLTDSVTAAVDAVVVSGTGASSVPASLTNATLRGFLSVTPTAILDGTQTTNTLTWNFNSGSEAFDFLATGETLVLTYTTSATDDNGTPLSDTETVTVTITGTGDAPIITGGPDTSSLSESNTGLTDSGTLTVTDLDLTDNVTAAVDAVVVSGTGASSVPASLTNATLRGFLSVTPTAILDPTQTTNTLTWNFNSGSEAFDFLATGETLVLTYTVSATDDNGTPQGDTETVTVTITGTGDAPIITGGPDTSSLTETNLGLTDSGTLTVTDFDLRDNVTAAVDAVVVSGTGASSVPASLTNATLRGFLSVTPTAILDGTQTTNTLTWSFNSGSEAFDFLATGETLVLTYTVSATDDNGIPLSDTETVTVTITGTGDAPTIVGGPITSAMTETGVGLSDSGAFTVTDMDTSDVVTASVDSVVVSGAGASSIPASLSNAVLQNFLMVSPALILDGTQTINTLTWDFSSGGESFKFLANGETLVLTYTFSVTDDDGAPLSDTEIVTITIAGVGNAPSITGGPATSTLLETNSGLADGGVFTVTDLDTSDTVAATVDSVTVSGNGAGRVPASLTHQALLGFLSVTPTAILDDTQNSATLAWNFDSGNEAFNFLPTGQMLVLNYVINATDSDGSSDTAIVTVTITGTNDRPTAEQDEYTTSYIDDLLVNLPGVTANDIDLDGDLISVVFVLGPTSGTATLSADGSLFYHPQPGFVGTTTIVYYVTDGTLNSAEQTILIHVALPTNLPPPQPADSGDGNTSTEGPTTTSATRNDGSGATDAVGAIEAETAGNATKSTAASIVVQDASSSRALHSVEAKFGPTNESSLLFSAQVGVNLHAPEMMRLTLAESNRLQLKQSQSIHLIFAQSEQQMQEEVRQDWLSQVDPLVATAVGTGIVIWLVHAGQFAAALLSTASTWVQLDPLTVLQGTKELDLATTSEEQLFEDKVGS